MDRRYLRLKSARDWLLAPAMLIVLAPIMLFIALLIRMARPFQRFSASANARLGQRIRTR